MRDASYESSILRIRLVINPAQQLCLTSPMQAIFVLIDLFWLNVSCLAIVRQTLQTRPSFGIKLRNNDPEVNPQVWAFVARKMAEIVTNKVDKIFIFYSVCWKIWCAAVRAFIVLYSNHTNYHPIAHLDKGLIIKATHFYFEHVRPYTSIYMKLHIFSRFLYRIFRRNSFPQLEQ